jgi:hypothetical protein
MKGTPNKELTAQAVQVRKDVRNLTHNKVVDPQIGKVAVHKVEIKSIKVCQSCKRKRAKMSVILWTDASNKISFHFCEEGTYCQTVALNHVKFKAENPVKKPKLEVQPVVLTKPTGPLRPAWLLPD